MALVVGASAPVGALAIAARWRVNLLAARAADAERKRAARVRRRSPRPAAPVPHASLDWLRPSLADPNAPEVGFPKLPAGIPGPGALAPARVCRACGHRNRMGAYRCARCGARLRE